MEFSLSPRLLAVAGWVPPDCRLADIGTDHALLPAWLLLQGRIRSAIAADLRPGPLRRAAETVSRFGLDCRIDLRLSDGLDGLEQHEADCVVMAGMGGETIRGILAKAPWTRTDTLLVLQPQSKGPQLRRWLAENGYSILRERCVRDGGHWYPILLVHGGTDDARWTPGTLLAGQPSRWEREPGRAAYLRSLWEHCARRRDGLLSALHRDEMRLEAIGQAMAELETWIDTLQKEQSK